MEKNKKILIVLGILIGVIGISLAYFVGKMLSAGEGANVKVTTANIKNSELNIEGELNFNALNMLLGHQDVSILKVTATGNNELIPFNIIWEGINDLGTALNFTVYKTSKEVKEKELKEPIEEGIIKENNKDSITLVEGEFINSTNTGYTMYYYIKLESKEKIEIEGKIKVEESTSKPKINIIAAYIEKEDGTYEKKTESLPLEGYTINEDKSICNNGATPKWSYENNSILVSNLTKNGTDCYLYYDILKGGEQILADNPTPEKLVEEFTGPSCDSDDTSTGCGLYNMFQNGLYESEDDDGITYYFRGSVTNNYIKFGKTGNVRGQGSDMYWRIIRINGDGSIRLIYDGTEIHENGTQTTNSIALALQKWNFQTQEINSEYKHIGLTWDDDNYRGYKLKSNVLQQLEKWYEENLIDENNIDKDAGFCNDRQPSSIINAIDGNIYSTIWFGSFTRNSNGQNIGVSKSYPTYKCSDETKMYNEDLYTIETSKKGNNKLTYPIGLITSDEAVYAGTYHGAKNFKYYLYNGEQYWTMTPAYFANNSAAIYIIKDDGSLNAKSLNTGTNLRPVINLSADVKLSGAGVANDPYVVE